MLASIPVETPHRHFSIRPTSLQRHCYTSLLRPGTN